MRNEPVIAGIAHGGIEKPVDDKRAGVLVHLVFDRLAADRHFDDDIDLARRIDPDRNGVNAHGWLRKVLKSGRPETKSWIAAARVEACFGALPGPGNSRNLNWSRRRRPCRATWARISLNCARPSGRRARGKTPSRDRCRRAPRSPCFSGRSVAGRVVLQ